MKKIINFIWMLILIILVGTSCLAAAPKTLQGDFQVFKLGESRTKVQWKIGDYLKEGKINSDTIQGDRIMLKQDNLPVTFRYYKSKLFMISILYQSGYKDIKDPRALIKYIKDMLAQTYGNPGETKEYPDKTEALKIYPYARWTVQIKEEKKSEEDEQNQGDEPKKIKFKNIDLVIRTDYLNFQEITVEIYLPSVRNLVDQELVKDFG